MDQQAIVPLRLRHEIWLAVAFLSAMWILTVFCYWSAHWLGLSVFLALVPGLALVFYFQAQLVGHAGANHRLGAAESLLPTLGSANWITLLRMGGVVGLAGFLPLPILHGQQWPALLSWMPGLVYLGVALADLLDGFIARKQDQETELGKHLDIEADAAGLLTASLVAIALGRLPAIYLLVGLAYYPFILGIWLRRRRARPLIALRSRPYARIMAGFQMGLVAVALLPVVNPYYSNIAAWIFMTPLLIGFLRDWLVVSCRVETDADQQCLLDRWGRSAIMKSAPLLLRLAVIAAGIEALANGGLWLSHPAWQLAHGVSCLLAGVGVMGRSAALGLVLLLGSNHSPFGTGILPTMLFGAAATLALTGTGAWSALALEENILYRGGRK